MLPRAPGSNVLSAPVAILDKDLQKVDSFHIQTFELCSFCGARFGIGSFGASSEDRWHTEEMEDLPRKLTQILAKDHRHGREHKELIELDF